MTIPNTKTWPKLTNEEEFRFLADLVLKRAAADHTVVNLHDQHTGTTRFANSPAGHRAVFASMSRSMAAYRAARVGQDLQMPAEIEAE